MAKRNPKNKTSPVDFENGEQFNHERECKRLGNCITHAITKYGELAEDIGPVAALEAAKRCADLMIKLYEIKALAEGKTTSNVVNLTVNGVDMKDMNFGNNGATSN